MNTQIVGLENKIFRKEENKWKDMVGDILQGDPRTATQEKAGDLGALGHAHARRASVVGKIERRRTTIRELRMRKKAIGDEVESFIRRHGL